MGASFSTTSLVRRGLRHFWRTHVGVVLGCAVATAVLVGALAVGDSVRLSLGEQARNRIGRIDAALVVRDRYFQSDLGNRMRNTLGQGRIATALQFQGIVRNQDRDTRAGIVDVYGVDHRFFPLSPGGKERQPPAPGETLLNHRLATHLGVGTGDSLLLRVEKPSLLPRDMVMATIDDISFALRLKVAGVLRDEEFGRFGLRASQVPPFNLFLSLTWLQEQLQLKGRANVILVGETGRNSVEVANQALAQNWNLGDAELHIQNLEGTNLFELTSDRVFLDPPVVSALRKHEPGLVGLLTYFVNGIRHKKRNTPYSMVTAIGVLSGEVTDPELKELLALLPANLSAGSLVVNDWLARDLQIQPGDPLELDYFVMGPQLQLNESSHKFKVQKILPIAGAAKDPSLMPAFPGLENTENCRDWEPGIPVKLERIRDKDEKYWDDHRGTPKAFLELHVGVQLFQNRYGSLTAVRGPQPRARQVAEQIQRSVDPGSLGLFFQDIRGPALAAGTSATDFGGLFLGLSFFLITAALLLTALLFVFGVEQRANEIGTLLAIGFRPRQVRRLFLLEALLLATAGSVVGAGLGLGYTQAVLYGLGTLWQGAVGATTLTFYAPPATIAMGTVIGILVAVGAIWLTLRKVFSHAAIELLQSKSGIPTAPIARTSGRGRISLILAAGGPVLAIVLVIVASGTSSQQAAGAFFGAGALLLVGALAGCRRLLTHLRGATGGIASVSALGVRNAGRRPGRSLATIALLASGTFLVVAVQANRLEPPQDASVRASGTGGFALFGRSTMPVLRDLGSKTGREAFDLDERDLEDVAIVPLRVRDGDDASCLNLSLPQNPALVGVAPKALAERAAFQFAASDPATNNAPQNPWLLLDADYGDNVVPAIGDAASVTWTLHKSVGDTIAYQDEQGREFQVRIVGTVQNSILQGNLVVAEERLKERFPSASGYRMFLIDAPSSRAPAVASNLTRALEDIGFEVTPTQDRLAAFNAVQNTYLLIFQLLGGLGLLLGSIGVGMVVLRNTLERRSELAVLGAVGYPGAAVRRLVWSEHGVLLSLGLASGVIAALLAVIPGARASLSLTPMGLLVLAVAACGGISVWLATSLATRGSLLGALRSE